MIFIYIILLLAIGPTFLQLINNKNNINIDKLNAYEKISLSMISSLLIFVIYMFIWGIICEYSIYLFIPLVINFLYQLLNLINKILKRKWHVNIFKIKWTITNLFTLVLVISIILWIVHYMFLGLINFEIYPDEYAVWLLNPKNIFLGKKMTFFMNTGLEIYPNFLPLLSSGYYFLINTIEENGIRIFSSIFMLISLFGLMGLAKRKKININCILLLLIFMFISYEVVASIMFSSYGDIPFVVTYTLGMLYLFEWLVVERKKEYLVISIVNMMAYSFIKTEALYLVLFSIALLVLSSVFYKKLKIEKINNKSIITYSSLLLMLPIAWKVYNILAEFPARLTGVVGVNLQYTPSLLANMTIQLMDCMPWVITIVIFMISIILLGHKLTSKQQKFIVLGLITIVANIVFLIVSYIAVFGAEAEIAASFIRYMTRLYFIMIFITAISITPFFSKK